MSSFRELESGASSGNRTRVSTLARSCVGHYTMDAITSPPHMLFQCTRGDLSEESEGTRLAWSGIPDSNRYSDLGRVSCYHYTNTAFFTTGSEGRNRTSVEQVMGLCWCHSSLPRGTLFTLVAEGGLEPPNPSRSPRYERGMLPLHHSASVLSTLHYSRILVNTSFFLLSAGYVFESSIM